jgi:hypothetical protein
MKAHLFAKIQPIFKWILLFAIVNITALTLNSQVFASTINTIPRYGFLPGVTAYAQVSSSQIPGSSNGNCGISSYTSPATNINVVGWTWWQCDRYNGTILVQSIHTGASVQYGASSHSDGFTWINAFTGGVNKLKAHGVHDLNHTGSSPSPWQPYNVNVYP